MRRSRDNILGVRLGGAINHVITIVHPRAFARWLSESKFGKKVRKRGRPRTPEQIRQLIVEIAKTTGWGYRRILGELKKLRIRNVSRATVRRVLQKHGFDPGPKRGRGAWHELVGYDDQDIGRTLAGIPQSGPAGHCRPSSTRRPGDASPRVRQWVSST